MQDSVRRAVGSIAIAWNKAENAIARMAALYLDVDPLTFELLVKPLRAQDREKLLKSVLDAKEFDLSICEEIVKSLRRAKICRENRNKILHRLGELDGELTKDSQDMIDDALDAMVVECDFLGQLYTQLVAIVFDRAARDVPNDEGQTGEDELRPVVVFVAPPRPRLPRKLDFERLGVVE